MFRIAFFTSISDPELKKKKSCYQRLVFSFVKYECVHTQLYWTLHNPMDYIQPTRLLSHLPGKNTGMDCHFFLQVIFPPQRLNLCSLHLLHWQADSLPLCHLEFRLKKYPYIVILTISINRNHSCFHTI